MSAIQENGLSCHWVSVTDAEGRARMEMRWSTPSQVTATPHAA
jgi:hypothetical protein